MDPNTDHIVPLDSDHPGFRDIEYRKQRDRIARAATRFWERWSKVKDGGGDVRSVSIPIIEYNQKNHDTWNKVYNRLIPLIKTNAISSYLRGFELLEITGDEVPQLADISAKLENITGFRLVPIEGLVKAREFLTSLLNKEFPATQYIRHHKVPGFTPEPDLCHEILGHAVLLTREDITELAILIGKAAAQATEQQVKELERLYWFTIEYGLCEEDGQVKTYGAGNLSSYADMERCVDPSQVKHLPFEVGDIIENDYDPTIQQPQLYVVSSFNSALGEIKEYCSSIFD